MKSGLGLLLRSQARSSIPGPECVENILADPDRSGNLYTVFDVRRSSFALNELLLCGTNELFDHFGFSGRFAISVRMDGRIYSALARLRSHRVAVQFSSQANTPQAGAGAALTLKSCCMSSATAPQSGHLCAIRILRPAFNFLTPIDQMKLMLLNFPRMSLIMSSRSRLMKRAAFGLILTRFFSTSAAGNHGEIADYSFIDTTGGAGAALLTDPSRLVMEEEGIAASFCDRKSGFNCFTTALISFAVPREGVKQRSWSYGGRLYCVVRSYSTIKRSPAVNDIHLIFSGVASSCDSTVGFDTSSVYSDVHGLRLIRHRLPTGRLLELYALDPLGFGVRLEGESPKK